MHNIFKAQLFRHGVILSPAFARLRPFKKKLRLAIANGAFANWIKLETAVEPLRHHAKAENLRERSCHLKRTFSLFLAANSQKEVSIMVIVRLFELGERPLFANALQRR